MGGTSWAMAPMRSPNVKSSKILQQLQSVFFLRKQTKVKPPHIIHQLKVINSDEVINISGRLMPFCQGHMPLAVVRRKMW